MILDSAIMDMMKEQFDLCFKWTYEGIDFEQEGRGGQECANFIPLKQKVIGTTSVFLIALLQIYYVYPHLTLPRKIPPAENGDMTGRKLMLLVQCFTFGCEIAFKCAAKQTIDLLNLCHVVTAVQVYIVSLEYFQIISTQLALLGIWS